jgi:hypothetical protein
MFTMICVNLRNTMKAVAFEYSKPSSAVHMLLFPHVGLERSCLPLSGLLGLNPPVPAIDLYLE